MSLSLAHGIFAHCQAFRGNNNFMVAERFEIEPVLDAIMDYVFILMMRPIHVRLRLLEGPVRRFMYLLVERV